MQKYRYTVIFQSAKDDAKKDAIVKEIQDVLKPYITNGTITAESDAIHVDHVEVGEIYPIYQG